MCFWFIVIVVKLLHILQKNEAYAFSVILPSQNVSKSTDWTMTNLFIKKKYCLSNVKNVLSWGIKQSKSIKSVEILRISVVNNNNGFR